jgi:flagellar M-ring protein FliF
MTNAIPPAMLDGVRRMSGTRRFLTFGGLLAALAVIWVVARFGSSPSMVPLYAGLDLREVSSMTDALAKAGIRFELAGGGTTIMVDESSAPRARVALAKLGLPSRGGQRGNEIFDQPSFGLTADELRTRERIALEGELSRTIGELEGVERATVHLALPPESPLRRLERPAKASVVLTLRPGRTFGPEAVQGITYIVSNAVAQLPSDQVAVLDSEGHLLSTPNDGSMRGLTSRQLEMQRSVEDYLAHNAERILATALGAGEARVQVAAKLNFEQVDKTVETYNPDGAVLQNEQRSEVTGADSLEGGGSTVVNNTYLNSRVVEKVAGSVGGIQRLTVAVLLDQKAIAKAAGPGGSADISRYEQVVRDAIGIDTARGDRLTVTAVPFEPVTINVDAQRLGAGGGSTEQMLTLVDRFSRPAIGLVGIIAALILSLKILRPGPGGPGGGQSFPPARQGGGAFAQADEPQLPPVQVSQLSTTTTRLKNEVQAESTARPEMAAQVVKTWLAEG